MSKLKPYRLRAFGFPLVGLVYVAVALTPPPAGSQEIFPFFNWSLFSKSSDEKLDVIAIVHSINGEPLPKAMSFYDLPERFRAASERDARFMKLLDQFALALLRKDEKKIIATRELVENHFMRDNKSVKYDIALIRYDPIERYKYKKIRSIRTLGRFSKQ